MEPPQLLYLFLLAAPGPRDDGMGFRGLYLARGKVATSAGELHTYRYPRLIEQGKGDRDSSPAGGC